MPQQEQYINPFLKKIRDNYTSLPVLSIFLGITTLLATYYISTPYSINNIFTYKIGDIAQKDIIINRDIFYENLDEIQKYKQEAMQNQRHIFDRSYTSLRNVIQTLDLELSLLSQSFTSNISIKQDLHDAYLKKNYNYLSIFKKDVLSNNAIEWASQYATLFFDNFGILEAKIPLLDTFDKVGAEVHSINTNSNVTETMIWFPHQFIQKNQIFEKEQYTKFEHLSLNKKILKQKSISSITKKILIHRILELYIQNPSVTYNTEKTKIFKNEAANKIHIKPILIKKGTTILRQGDPIDSITYNKLKIIEIEQRNFYIYYTLGIFILFLLIIISLSTYAHIVYNLKNYALSNVYIIFSLIILYLTYSFLIFHNLQNQEFYYFLTLLPNGFIGIITTFLVGANITLLMGIYLSFWMFLLSGSDVIALTTFIAILAGSYATLKIHKRGDIKKPTLILFASSLLCFISYYCISNFNTIKPSYMVILILINSFICTLLSSSILPIYENIFNLPTKFRLLELADTSNTLIQKISNETPSTYTHTMLVSSLSEQAVLRLKGNVLLTKVGCLYHDIGKTIEPHFFAENRHLKNLSKEYSKLTNLQATQTIINHVTEGIRIAEAYNLPKEVIAFIPEHHGTTTIHYFYHQALKEQETKRIKKIIKKEHFQYPGPKPQTKETAVVMIADSVDAASRSIDNPTLENLSTMVDTIIQNKLSEHQFDECNLTIKDLKIIKESFLDVLINSFHLRPKYPTQSETKKLESNLQKKSYG